MFKALHVPTLSLVAVKTINFFDEGQRHQLLREIKVFSKLQSDFIATYEGAFKKSRDDQQVCLLTRWMDRGSLKTFVERNGPLSEPLLQHIALQFTRGLNFLSSKYQIHRDIKPANILLDHNGRVRISDFGLTKELAHSLGTTNAFLGTMSYLSPERFRRQVYSFPSDIWSMGVSLLFCALGKDPFDAQEVFSLLHEITTLALPKLLDENKFSSNARHFLALCTEQNPQNRATAAQLLQHPWLENVSDTTLSRPDLWRNSLKENEEALEQLCSGIFNHFCRDNKMLQEFLPFLSDHALREKLATQLDLPTSVVSSQFDKTISDLSARQKRRQNKPNKDNLKLPLKHASVEKPLQDSIHPTPLRPDVASANIIPLPSLRIAASESVLDASKPPSAAHSSQARAWNEADVKSWIKLWNEADVKSWIKLIGSGAAWAQYAG